MKLTEQFKYFKIMWIARDKDGELTLFYEKPNRIEDEKMGFAFWDSTEDSMCLDSELFPELLWEDKPVKVELVKSK